MKHIPDVPSFPDKLEDLIGNQVLENGRNAKK
jgi:hypothetical protein